MTDLSTLQGLSGVFAPGRADDCIKLALISGIQRSSSSHLYFLSMSSAHLKHSL